MALPLIGIIFFYIFEISITLFRENPVPQMMDAVGLLAILAVPFAFVLTAKNPRARLFFSLIGVFFLILAISTAIVGNANASKFAAMGYDILADGKLFGIALACLAFQSSKQVDWLFKKVALAFLIVGAANFVFILHDVALGFSIRGVALPSRQGITTPLGLFAQKDISAATQLFGMIAALMFSRERGQRVPFFWRAVAAVFALSVLVHLSVKEIAALFFVSVLYFATSGRGALAPRALGLIMLSLIATAALLIDTPVKAAFLDRIGFFVTESRGETVRTAAYRGSLQLSSEYFPVGTGASTFMSNGARDLAYSPFYYKTGIAYMWGGTPRNPMFIMDTFWPKILAQSGWFGFAAYALAQLYLAWLAFKLCLTSRSPYAFGASAIVFSMLIFSFAAPAYTYDHLVFPAAIAIAYVLSRDDAHRRAELAKRRPVVGRLQPGGGPVRPRTARPGDSHAALRHGA